MQSERIVTELIVDSRKSAAGTDSYVRDMQRAGTATEQEQQRIGRSFSYSEKQAAAYLGQLSPVIAAQNRLGAETRQAEGAIKSLGRQLMTGSITANDHAQKLALVTGRIGEMRVASQQMASTMRAQDIAAYGQELDRLRARYSPLFAAQQAYRGELSEINRALKVGALNEAEHAAAIDRTKTAFASQVVALKGAKTAVQETTAAVAAITPHANAAAVSTGQMRASLINLGQQAQDVFVTLQAGQNPLTILAQQGSQIGTVFATTPGILGAVGTAIKNMISPTTAVIAGMAALGTGLAFLLVRAGATEERLRSFDVILRGMGTSSNTTSLGLDQVVRGLRNTGSAADEALKSVQAFARVPGINPASAAMLVPLSRDIGAATGGDMASIATRLAAAFAESTTSAIAFVQAIAGPNGLTAGELANMKVMAAHGDRAGALKIAVDALQRQFGGGFQAAQSGSEKAITSIGAAWDNMVTKLENTSFIKNIRDFMVSQMNDIANAVKAVPPVPSVDWRAERNAAIRQANPNAQNYPGFTPNYGVGGALTGRTTADTAAIGRLIELGATEAEIAILSQIRQRESGGLYNTFHATGATVSSLDEVRAFPGRSHAFGGYGFQPGTYQSMSARTGVADISPGAQDANALALLRLYGPNSTASWAASAPRGGYASGVFANVGQAAASVAAAPTVPPGLTEAQKGLLQDQVDLNNKIVESARKVGESKVYWEAYNTALGAGAKDDFDRAKATETAQQAVSLWRAELEKGADTQRIVNDLALQGAEAFGKDEVSGLRAAAAAQAELAVRAGDASSVQAKANELLRTGAAEAIGASAKALPGLVQQAAASERLAAAAAQGTGAAHAAGVQNQVTAATHDALTKAIATGDPALISRAEKLRALTEQQIKANDAAQQDLAIRQRINERTDQIAVVQLQTGLQGQLPETIAAATAHLQEQQRLLAQGKDLNSDIAKKSLENVDALSRANIQLAAATRESQRWDDVFRTIGDSISRFIGDALTGLFDKKKVIDWGAQLKSIMSSVFSQVAQSLLIRPLTGELLGALGASPNVVNQFGSFGGSGATGSSGGLSMGTLLQGGGLLKDLFGGSGGLFGGSGSGGLFSGASGWFSNLGTSLGFAPSAGAPFSATVMGPSMPGISTGGLFGSTSFGSALGGIGAGFTAGTLLNSLVGGNSTGGMLGSGGGALAGALIGSIVPGIGTLIGGLIGGAGGGLLGGMFGNSKPSNASAGANFDLSSFSLTAGFAGGNQQIDQATQQMAQGLQQFLAVLKETGGSLSGNVLLQHGVNTGITVDSSLPEFSGRFNLGKDPVAALRTIELALAQSLTGITDTMQTVLDQTADPAELQANIAFANSYDKLSEAAADAFKSVEDASKTTAGPFRQAMEQITAIFQGLTDQANRFGLALDPINAALAEATRRLQGDFTTALNTAFNEATGVGFINQLQGVYDQTLVAMQESIAIGLGADPATQDMISLIYGAQLNSILSGLDQTQIDQVVTHFTGLNDTIVLLAQNTVLATDSTQALADAQAEAAQLAAQGAQAMQQIQDYLNQLNATPSAFVSPEDALAASAEQYSQQLFAAQSGDVDALSSITQYADQFIKNIEAYYASSEYGQRLVDNIQQELQTLIGSDVTIKDPAVLTNELLVDQLAKTDTLTTTVTAGTDQTGLTITAGTQQLIDSNNAVAASTIAQYTADTATLVDVTNSTAAENIAMNQAASASLIASNDNTTASILAQSDAAAAALIASNDNSTVSLVAAANATTAALLADTSGDTTAVGLVIQNVGDQLSWVMTEIGNSQLTAIYDSVHYHADIATALANNQIAATFEAASSLINVGATYSNAQASATYGAAGGIVQSEAIYANNNLIAISTASASNDNWLSQINGWQANSYQAQVYYGDTTIRQLQDVVNLLTQIRDAGRLYQAAA